MTDKKQTVKRLVIYLLIAFVPFWIVIPIMNAHNGGPIFVSDEMTTTVYTVGVFGMFIPSIAHLITRLVTKEGFKNSCLGLNIEGNVKYYILSVAVKIAEVSVVVVLIWLIFAKELSFSEVFASDEIGRRAGTYIFQISASVIIFFPAFGEEWGWRGYMMPKLTELMGKPWAVIVGGVLWGLWHAPLTISGHNFGTEYRFFPWLGILLMCVFCVCMNAFLTLLTEKTKSIYPASFCHMVNNNCGAMIFISIFGSDAFIERIVNNASPITNMYVMLITTGIVGVVSFILLIKKEKQTLSEEKRAA